MLSPFESFFANHIKAKEDEQGLSTIQRLRDPSSLHLGMLLPQYLTLKETIMGKEETLR